MIMDGIDEGWFPYLESIDLLRFLRDFIKEQEGEGDESVDKNTKPETYEVMVHNFNHLRDKTLRNIDNKRLFSKKDVDLLFEELKRVPVKFSLKNLKVMALEMGKSLRANKVIGSHFLTFVLSLEKVLDPPRLLKENAEKYGFPSVCVV